MKKLSSLTFTSIAVMIFLLLAFALAVGIIGYKGFTKALLNQYADGAFRTASIGASYVNGEHIDEFLEPHERWTMDYLQVWDDLNQLCNLSDVTFIYVIKPDTTDYAHITFIYSTVNKESKFKPIEAGFVRDTTNDEYREKYQLLVEGLSDQELVIRDRGYIETDPHITAMVPIKNWADETTAILCVQRQMEVLYESRRAYVGLVFRIMLTMLAVACIAQVFFLRQKLLKPVVRITEEASRFAAENVMAEQKLRQTIRSRDEIGMLAESIDTMEERIHHYVEDLKVITAERERISTELSLAARIQNNMLPTIFPAFPDRTEFDIYASMTPAKEVGGDFYDFFMVDRDHLCILIADVSGKGIPAALFMMASKIILKNNAMMRKSPATILEHTNYAICSSNEEEMFITVWLGILEISTGKLTAANAGHEYPALKTGDGKFELYKDKHGFVVGGLPGMKYKEYEIQMENGSTIFVYTDGLSEASDEAEQMFGTDRIFTALNNDPEASPKELLTNMSASVAAFVKDAEQFDDLTMLALTYYGPGAPREEKKKEVNEEVSEENGEGEDPS